jgi:hypothetical protein
MLTNDESKFRQWRCTDIRLPMLDECRGRNPRQMLMEFGDGYMEDE